MSLAKAIDEAAAQLIEARVRRRPCRPVRDLLPAGDLDAAYAVQSAWAAQKVSAGARVVGRKIGLTNPQVQAQLGVDQPDFGVLFDDMACGTGDTVDIDRLMQPKIEAEIAFVLKHDFDGGPINPAQVVTATDHVMMAFEIVDSRIADWDISIVDTIADNASSGLYVLAADRRRLGGLDLSQCQMTMRRNGQLVSSGGGAKCLGNPLHAVAWLADKARSYGDPLRAGDMVLSGALGLMAPVNPGDTFDATITGFGSLHLGFSQGRR